MSSSDNKYTYIPESGDEPIVDEDFSRGRFVRAMKTGQSIGATTASVDDSDEDDAPAARSYALTGGRTTTDPSLQFETMVRSDASAFSQSASLRDHELRIANAVKQEPLSIAEVAVAVGMPIGVVRVLVGDLIEKQFLVRSTNVSNPDDADGHVELLKRVISRVEAL